MGTDDRDVLFRAQRLVDGGSPIADTLMENVNLRARIAALEAQLTERDAEIERLRADLVWAVRSGAWFCDGPETFLDDCDGTPESICRAVREARDGE